MNTDIHAIERRIDLAGTLEKRSPIADRGHVMDSIVDATALVAGITETTRILVRDKPVSVELLAPDLPVMVTTDLIILTQIIMSLMKNAIRSTERGKITIDLKVIGRTPEIVVTDTGSGIRTQRLAELANVEDRAGSAGSLDEEAIVPCLSACRKLARIIGGSISVRSVHGRGAMFTLTLPLRAADRRRDLYAVE